MPLIVEGGTPHTTQVTVGATPTPLVLARVDRSVRPYRSGFVVQQAGNVEVTIGGANVVAGIGYILRANPDSTSQPAAFGNTTSGQAYYGIVASGTGTVNVIEEY